MKAAIKALLFASCMTYWSEPALADPADLSQVMIDVSSHNNLSKLIPFLNDRKIELVFIRATIGLNDVDDAYDKNVQLLRDRSPGTLTGAYHALYPTSPGGLQARDFLIKVKLHCRPGEQILLAVDWEKPHLKKARIEAASADQLEEFVGEIQAKTGKLPMIYTGPDIIGGQRKAIGPLTARAPLWLSTYYSKLYLARNCGSPEKGQSGFTCNDSIHGLMFPDEADYAPWKTWTFWQFSAANKEDPAYIRNTYTTTLPVDVSFYGGGRDEFKTTFAPGGSVKCEDIKG
jgi:GH25 family lysozyme M1 (1,4-beta-N-acetylmuramidase)